MKRLSGREMKAFLILSIVVPVGLLTTLRLTGVLKESLIIAETKTLETVEWEFQRPDNYLAILKTLRVPFVQNGLSATFNLIINHYDPNTLSINFDEVSITIMMNFTVTHPHAFIRSVNVAFSMDNHSRLGMLVTRDITRSAENLSLTGHSWSHEGTKAYISFEGIGQPRSAYLSTWDYWILISSFDQIHQLEVAYELIYNNGTAYKKLVQPFQLNLLGA